MQKTDLWFDSRIIGNHLSSRSLSRGSLTQQSVNEALLQNGLMSVATLETGDVLELCSTSSALPPYSLGMASGEQAFPPAVQVRAPPTVTHAAGRPEEEEHVHTPVSAQHGSAMYAHNKVHPLVSSGDAVPGDDSEGIDSKPKAATTGLHFNVESSSGVATAREEAQLSLKYATMNRSLVTYIRSVFSNDTIVASVRKQPARLKGYQQRLAQQ